MAAPAFRLLVVCTANICRSVMAELMLRREIERRGLDVEVSSCGILFDGEPATDTVIAVLDERDLDAREHRSTKFDPSLLDGVGLVLTMERLHARELTIAVDGSAETIFTLGAFVAWLSDTDIGEVTAQPGERVAEFAATRRASDLLGSGSDEVADPHGRSKRVHRKAADRIDELCVGLIDGLFPR